MSVARIGKIRPQDMLDEIIQQIAEEKRDVGVCIVITIPTVQTGELDMRVEVAGTDDNLTAYAILKLAGSVVERSLT